MLLANGYISSCPILKIRRVLRNEGKQQIKKQRQTRTTANLFMIPYIVEKLLLVCYNSTKCNNDNDIENIPKTHLNPYFVITERKQIKLLEKSSNTR